MRIVKTDNYWSIECNSLLLKLNKATQFFQQGFNNLKEAHQKKNKIKSNQDWTAAFFNM